LVIVTPSVSILSIRDSAGQRLNHRDHGQDFGQIDQTVVPLRLREHIVSG
jgi:hypothetical protein